MTVGENRQTDKHLRQKSEMTIDDTWPEMGGMRPSGNNRILDKIATDDLGPQQTSQQHNATLGSHFSVVSHTEGRRRVVFGLPELSNVYSTHHDHSSCATKPQDVAFEAANPGC